MKIRTVAVLASVTLLPLVAPQQAQASSPGANGRIAYATYRDSMSVDIRATRLDGSASLKLTTWRERDTMPAYSRDGTKIAWAREVRRGNPFVYAWELWAMNSDGSSKHRIMPVTSELRCPPSWSPDGQKLTFVQNGSTGGGYAGRVFTINANGTGLTQLTQNDGPEGTSTDHTCAQWSPDGTLIAFGRMQSGPDEHETRNELRVMAPDGSGQRIVVGNSEFMDDMFSLDWHPNGTKLLYNRGGYCPANCWPGKGLIRTVNLDGTGDAPLNVPNQLKPGSVWSPDGTRIAYVRLGKGIFTVNPDGSDERLLRVEKMAVWSLSWQPLPA